MNIYILWKVSCIDVVDVVEKMPVTKETKIVNMMDSGFNAPNCSTKLHSSQKCQENFIPYIAVICLFLFSFIRQSLRPHSKRHDFGFK